MKDVASIDIQAARRHLEEREQARQATRDRRHEQAVRDAASIVEMLAVRYQPRRIYQWGSLLNRKHFNERSDIDLAVEGVRDAAEFFAMHREADAMTAFSLDLVELEKIAPEFADIIRMKGRVVYERSDGSPGPGRGN